MPSLAQSLSFITYTNTASTQVVYPNSTDTTIVYYSDPVKGDGYYGASDGLHTVMYTLDINFIGTVTMQASLASQPVETDWFEISDISSSYNDMSNLQSTQVDYYNFTGNFVWVRGVVIIEAGTVNSILYNH
jgi:hypothetical protein